MIGRNTPTPTPGSEPPEKQFDKSAVYNDEMKMLLSEVRDIAIRESMPFFSLVLTKNGENHRLVEGVNNLNYETQWYPSEFLIMQSLSATGARGLISNLIKGICSPTKDIAIPIMPEDEETILKWAAARLKERE